ncbi:MAG: N-acetylglucosamine kinase [Flavobacterium sp.]|nr:N-acetylglucosamine kinase [Pedobacter sp.]
MILIADSGSTKTSWALISKAETTFVHTEGYNPYYMNADYIRNSVEQSFEDLAIRQAVTQVFFYGAGCSPERKEVVLSALRSCFLNAKIEVQGDLLAAARCLLGGKEGFAAILGTGTNSCFYNGNEIISTIDSLGFLVGDEGSGAYLGKQIIKSYVRGLLPSHLTLAFKEQFQFTEAQLISELYASKSPNKFSAQFCAFAGKHVDEPFILELTKTSFRDFFNGIIVHYKNYKGFEISFVGSVAFVFLPILKSVAEEFSMNVGKAVKCPLADLIDYHLKNPVQAI